MSSSQGLKRGCAQEALWGISLKVPHFALVLVGREILPDLLSPCPGSQEQVTLKYTTGTLNSPIFLPCHLCTQGFHNKPNEGFQISFALFPINFRSPNLLTVTVIINLFVLQLMYLNNLK